MIVGFNHNILYRGIGFHVQTEDGGLKNPHLVTLLYHEGMIVSSQKTSYVDILGVDNLNQVVEDLAKEQHKGMLRRLTQGEFDPRLQEFGIVLEGVSKVPETELERTSLADEETETIVSSEGPEEVAALDESAEKNPLREEENDTLAPIPAEIPEVVAEEQTVEKRGSDAEPVSGTMTDSPVVGTEMPTIIEPAFDPPNAKDRDRRQDVSEALDDLIFSYLTGGDEEN